MIKLISILTGRKIVLLLGDENQFYRTLESRRNNPFTDTKYCYINWFTKTGLVNLHAEGKTTGRCYIKKWHYE